MSKQKKEPFRLLGQILVDMRKVTKEELEGAIADQKDGELLGQALVRRGNIGATELRDALAKQESAQQKSSLDQLQILVLSRPDDADLRLQLGQAYLKARKYDDALRELREGLKLKPDHIPFFVPLGNAFLKVGNTDEAIKFFTRAFQKEPNERVRKRLIAAYLQAARTKPEVAIQELSKAAKLDPNHPEVVLEMAVAYLSAEQFANATRYLTQAVRLYSQLGNGDQGKPLMLLGEVYEREEKWDMATQAYKQAFQANARDPRPLWALGEMARRKGEVEAAVRYHQQAVKVQSYVPSLYALGQIHDHAGERDKAIALLREAIAQDHNHALSHCLLGQLYAIAGDFHNAQEHLVRALQIDPENPQVHHGLGIAFLEQKRYDDAIERFMKAIDLDPTYVEAQVNLGAVFHRQGRMDRALKEYATALVIDPDHLIAMKNLARLKFERGDVQEAVQLYERILDLEPQNVPLRQNLGNCYRRVGQIDKAIAEYEKVLAKYPHSADTLLNLGVSYYERGTLIRSIETLNLLAELQPQYRSVAFLYLCKTYRKNDQPSRALEYIKQAVREEPSNPEIHLEYGYILQEMGFPERAMESFEKVLKFDPENKRADKAIRAIAYDPDIALEEG